MTCDEVRQIVTTRSSDTCTRAERAAVYGHLMVCYACVLFMAKEAAGATPEQAARTEKVADELFRDDIKDPEYVRTVFGDRP